MRAGWPYLALLLAAGGCTGAIGANAGSMGTAWLATVPSVAV